MTAPRTRLVDQLSGEVVDSPVLRMIAAADQITAQAEQVAVLIEENAELRCRRDELEASQELRLREIRRLGDLLAEAHAERDILATQRAELVEQRNTALYERDTARAELAAKQ